MGRSGVAHGIGSVASAWYNGAGTHTGDTPLTVNAINTQTRLFNEVKDLVHNFRPNPLTVTLTDHEEREGAMDLELSVVDRNGCEWVAQASFTLPEGNLFMFSWEPLK